MRARIHTRSPGFFVIILVLATSMSSADVPRGQSKESEVQLAGNVMAAFVYKFTGYIRWPVSAQSGPIRIAVLGESPLSTPLAEIAGQKKIAKRSIEFQRVDDPAALETCHILVVSGEDDEVLLKALEHLRDSHTMVITHHEGAALRGAGINFVIREGRIRFEINLAALQRAALIPNARLLKFALIIEETPTEEEP